MLVLIIAINPPINPTRELSFIHLFGDLYLIYLFRYLWNVTVFQASIRHWRYIREQKTVANLCLDEAYPYSTLFLHLRMLHYFTLKDAGAQEG